LRFALLQNPQDFTLPYVIQVDAPYLVGRPIIESHALSDGDHVGIGEGLTMEVAGTFTGLPYDPEQADATLREMAEYYRRHVLR